MTQYLLELVSTLGIINGTKNVGPRESWVKIFVIRVIRRYRCARERNATDSHFRIVAADASVLVSHIEKRRMRRRQEVFRVHAQHVAIEIVSAWVFGTWGNVSRIILLISFCVVVLEKKKIWIVQIRKFYSVFKVITSQKSLEK